MASEEIGALIQVIILANIEVLGLHIQDLEFHRNGVVIRRRSGLANGALAKGMVEREERFIELTPQVMALLDHLVLQHTFETDHVFVILNKQARNRQGESTYGAPLSRHALKSLFRYYSQKTGIPLHAHLLRHTHATELIRAGWDASYVQERLGHANVQTTINTYVHLDDEDLSQKWRDYQERKKKHHDTPTTD
jgi:integrase/recombinase XerD